MNALAQGQLLPAPLEELRQPLARRRRELALRLPGQGQPRARPPDRAGLALSIGPGLQALPDDVGRTRRPARVLAKLDDGQPLLAERPVGPVRSSSSGPRVHVDWTNLPAQAALPAAPDPPESL